MLLCQRWWVANRYHLPNFICPNPNSHIKQIKLSLEVQMIFSLDLNHCSQGQSQINHKSVLLLHHNSNMHFIYLTQELHMVHIHKGIGQHIRFHSFLNTLLGVIYLRGNMPIFLLSFLNDFKIVTLIIPSKAQKLKRKVSRKIDNFIFALQA